MSFVSNYVHDNRKNFHLQLLRHFSDIAAFVVGSFSLLHPVKAPSAKCQVTERFITVTVSKPIEMMQQSSLNI